MFFAGDDRFSAANTLKREYDSLLENKQFLLKENQDLREFDRQMQQKLTSHHEVMRMLTTNIQSVKLEIQRLESIKAQLLDKQSSSEQDSNGTNEDIKILDNQKKSEIPTSIAPNKVSLQEILTTLYSEDILSSMDYKDILHVIQTLQQAVKLSKE